MKTSAIIRIIVFSLLAFALTGVMISCMLGYGSVFVFNDVFSYLGVYEDNDKYSVGNAELSPDGIKSFDINWIAGSVEVKPYDGDTISISETGNEGREDKHKLRYYADDNGTLHIRFSASRVFFLSFGTNTMSKRLNLLIPEELAESIDYFHLAATSAAVTVEDINADDLNIDNTSGEMVLTNITARKATIDSVSGALTASDFTSNEVKIDVVSSDVRINGTIGDFKSNGVSGNLRLTTDVMPKSVKNDTVSGDFILTIPENDGFTAELDSVSGNMNSEFFGKYRDDKLVYKNGLIDFEFDSVSGDVEILMVK